MDTQIKGTWRGDLLSGDYLQGTEALCRVMPHGGSEYCCLGVLCEQAVRAGIVERVNGDDHGQPGLIGYRAVGTDDAPEFLTLPDVVFQWARLPDADPTVTLYDPDSIEDEEENEEVTLAEVNDDHRWTFGEITGLLGQL